jgi:hypothetical protein
MLVDLKGTWTLASSVVCLVDILFVPRCHLPAHLVTGSVSLLYGVSSAGTSLYIFDKDQGTGLTVLSLTTKLERLAAPSQVRSSGTTRLAMRTLRPLVVATLPPQ